MSNSEQETTGSKRRSIRTGNRAEASELAHEIIETADRRIDVLLHDFDEVMLPTEQLTDMLARFMRKHDHNQFRLLLAETRHLTEKGGALIEFARRFSSFVKLRKVAEEYHPVSEQFIIGDDHMSLRQHDFTAPSYFASFNDRASARTLQRRFDELWQRSGAVPGIHVTGLSG